MPTVQLKFYQKSNFWSKKKHFRSKPYLGPDLGQKIHIFYNIILTMKFKFFLQWNFLKTKTHIFYNIILTIKTRYFAMEFFINKNA